MGSGEILLNEEPDPQEIFVNSCKLLPPDKTVLYVGSQKIDGASDLFYAPVTVGGQAVLNGLLDSGSMACTLSTEGESTSESKVLPQPSVIPGNVVLVGCGGLTIQPKCTYDLEVEVYGFKFIVPTLLVPGQKDEFIIGSNVIKCVLQKMKAENKYWELIKFTQNSNPECEEFLELLSCVSHWSGSLQPDKLGSMKLCQAVTLLPRSEHLVWGKLPANTHISPGSTVIVESTTSCSAPRHVLVGRVVSPMWGDRWVPMKILNPTQSPITLQRNTKLADVSPCLAVEDVSLTQGMCKPHDVTDSALPKPILKSSQVELYCHSATCGDIQWNEMSCLTGPRCYINTDIQQ